MLVDQYRLGRLDLDGFVSERIGIEDVEPAFEKMKAGTVLRSVVEINPVATSPAGAGR
jgi:S-(hydroxymethyl)mycothiol dehydrogenase